MKTKEITAFESEKHHKLQKRISAGIQSRLQKSLQKRKSDRNNDFSQFKTKIFFRTVLLAVVSIYSIFFLYSFLFSGRFANWTVALFQKLFLISYKEALNLYQQIFRNHMDIIWLSAIVLIFFIMFRIYLNWFTNYFSEINRGIDTLVQEKTEDILLPPELSSTEKKLNFIRHTIIRQKMDTKLAEQRKNDLVMYLAHDLKTPLASVIGYLDLLRDEPQISEELREKYLSISLEKAQRLEELINEFFDIARFNLSDISLQYGRISLTLLLEQLVYEFKPMLDEKNLSCRLDAEEDMLLACDADKIQRVFDNLLRNAVIYSFRDTEINISACRQEDNFLIRFANHGDTIPKDKLERIFEQFYRLDTARSTSSGGAGLGLAIAKQIVELHHGTIDAESEKECTVFTVILPVSPFPPSLPWYDSL